MTFTLNQALALVAPHRGTDKILPLLLHVKVENGKLMATDRYTLAIATPDQPSESQADLASYAPTLDMESNGFLTPDDVKSKPVKIANNEITFANGSTKTLSQDVGDYPNLAKLVENRSLHVADAALPYAEISLNPAYLARFTVAVPGSVNPANLYARAGKSERPTVHVALPSVATKPVTITLGEYTEDQYVGLIVPIRTMV